MTGARKSVLGLVVSLLAVTVVLADCGTNHPVPAPLTTVGAADQFLATYVTSDGRVIRHDQGGDIVSEGQAYGMLIAEVAGRPTVVRTIWNWTRQHLQQSDGLFAWHASGAGAIEDPQPAADADVLIAAALLRYRGSGAQSLQAAGRAVASAVLQHETVTVPGGGVLLVAGPWAATDPPTVNPSYLMPSVFSYLAKATGDQQWSTAAASAVQLVGGLTAKGTQLPSDWAQLQGNTLVASAAPSGGPSAQYGPDAARLPIWFGYSCDPAAVTLAGRWWRNLLSQHGRAQAEALSMDGSIVNGGTNPLSLLAAAAGAHAAGDGRETTTLRANAATVGRDAPTYYGSAWLALSAAISSGALFRC